LIAAGPVTTVITLLPDNLGAQTEGLFVTSCTTKPEGGDMPNWTKNTLTLRGDKAKIQEFRESVTGANGAMDFNMIVPMPQSLDITDGSHTDLGLACFSQEHFDAVSSRQWFPESYPGVSTPEQLQAHLLEKKPDVVDLGRQALANIRVYGVPTWYEWCCRTWGTKWNACDIELVEQADSLTYQFDTAWDAPRGLVEPLVERAHELGLSVVWIADHEDGGFEAIVN
jgi:hypothetical protein